MENFQDLVDNFFDIWVELFGAKGVTNYIHLFGSSHLQYFFEHFGPLLVQSAGLGGIDG